MTKARRAFIRLGTVVAIAAIAGCGSSSGGSSSSSTGSTDPVSTALQTPGVRTVLLAKQRGDVTIVVPPCPQQGKSAQSGNQPSGGVGDTKAGGSAPAGSSRILIPKGALTQTVAVQPCQSQQAGQSSSGGASSGGSSSGGQGQQAVSTILMTPGGTAPQSTQQAATQQNQLVVPENSSITTLVVPPCTMASSSGAGGQSQQQTKGQVLPAGSRSVTAPACTIPQQQQSSSG